MPKKLKTKGAKPEAKPIRREARVWVTRTIEERGKELGGDIATDLIAIHEFITEPARIGLEKSLPIQLAKFLIARVNVTVILPCYAEEVRAARKSLPGMVNEFLTEEAETLPDLLREVMDRLDL